MRPDKEFNPHHRPLDAPSRLPPPPPPHRPPRPHPPRRPPPEHGSQLHPPSPPPQQRPRPQPQRPTERMLRRFNPPTSPNPSPLAWILASCCAIFWALIVAFGLAILTVYLVLRPKTPRFDIPDATLNSIRLNVGILVDADLTFSANFTNPNGKSRMDFSYIVFGVYYRNNAIASGGSSPFSAAKRESQVQSVHIATSNVRLADEDVMELRREVDRNLVTLEVRGRFKAKARLGKVLGYSYRLHTRCLMNVTGPPNGTLVSHKCY